MAPEAVWMQDEVGVDGTGMRLAGGVGMMMTCAELTTLVPILSQSESANGTLKLQEPSSGPRPPLISLSRTISLRLSGRSGKGIMSRASSMLDGRRFVRMPLDFGMGVMLPVPSVRVEKSLSEELDRIKRASFQLMSK